MLKMQRIVRGITVITAVGVFVGMFSAAIFLATRAFTGNAIIGWFFTFVLFWPLFAIIVSQTTDVANARIGETKGSHLLGAAIGGAIFGSILLSGRIHDGAIGEAFASITLVAIVMTLIYNGKTIFQDSLQ